MTNREWLLNKMQSMSDEELYSVISFYCDSWGIKNEESCTSKSCRNCVTEWFKKEHKEKITLKEAERVILENTDKDYKWIARDEFENALYLYEDKPEKGNGKTWFNEDRNYSLELFNHLFQFITWQDEEPYNIEELLKE